MKTIFLSYEQSLALKDLGFNESCFAVYDKNKDIIITSDSKDHYYYENSAISFSQAFKWFRDKYKIQHTICSGVINTVFWAYDLLNFETQTFIINNTENGGGDCDYDTYEEAESACIDILIDIVK